jgi:hypothetical protein
MEAGQCQMSNVKYQVIESLSQGQKTKFAILLDDKVEHPGFGCYRVENRRERRFVKWRQIAMGANRAGYR